MGNTVFFPLPCPFLLASTMLSPAFVLLAPVLKANLHSQHGFRINVTDHFCFITKCHDLQWQTLVAFIMAEFQEKLLCCEVGIFTHQYSLSTLPSEPARKMAQVENEIYVN